DLLAGGKQRCGLLAHPGGVDALLAQLGLHQGGVGRAQLALHPRAAAVDAFPGKQAVLQCFLGHDYSLVTRLTSSRLVTPCMTLSRPEVRRSLKPSSRILAAISMELPSAMIRRCRAGVFLTTS